MRRYSAMKPSRGTVVPVEMRRRVSDRDYRMNMSSAGCVLWGLVPHECDGARELDHVRASHGMGLKSVTCDCNLVSLCGRAHRLKTENGKALRPILLDYLAQFHYDHETGHAA